MDDDARKRIRRAMLAKKATSPKVRGQYKRAVRAARLEQEAREQTEFGPRAARVRQTEAAAAIVPPPKRKSPRPLGDRCSPRCRSCSFSRVGAYALNVVIHAERAANKIADRPLQRGPQVVVATDTPRPTNTPNAFGTIEPLPTVNPTAIAAIAKATPIPTEAPPINFDRKDPFTMMLLGVDTREGDTDPRTPTRSSSSTSTRRTGRHVNMLSIPRDLLVTRRAASGRQDGRCLRERREQHMWSRRGTRGRVVSSSCGIRSSRTSASRSTTYAQVDFGGFKKIVDAFGGVTVDNPYPIKDDEYPTEDYQFSRVFFPAGILHLYGAQALQFARTRHDDNDFRRNARQQQVLLGIRQQALQLNLLPKATGLIDALGDSSRTDFPGATAAAVDLASPSSARTCRAMPSSSSHSPTSCAIRYQRRLLRDEAHQDAERKAQQPKLYVLLQLGEPGGRGSRIAAIVPLPPEAVDRLVLDLFRPGAVPFSAATSMRMIDLRSASISEFDAVGSRARLTFSLHLAAGMLHGNEKVRVPFDPVLYRGNHFLG